ncbi:Hsp70 family protein [Synechococcus sp. CCY9201]|uniref:Hsp70 family protein n=1 Tax=Synechococcus sp. CCY9201 TaxID=174697 RepID=UPI002B20EA5B|nr:Hsp70 family protein [Synechococcus sp. CCY9201]MEA5475472.1 Hsp70 family protein [Synechococcus sp. CCY9201]
MTGTLAIDLGSSTTVVAWQPDHGPPTLLELAPYACGDPVVVPSLLWLAAADSPRPLIGRQVLEAGLAADSSPSLCHDFKRLIGSGDTVPSQENAAMLLSPEQAGERLLQALWAALPAGIEPRRLVLTAPIESYRGYRRWLQEISTNLAVEEVALVDEPTAAAIGCGLSPGSRVLVVDLGGGTIDLSLVALEGGEGRAAPIAQLLRFAGRSLEDGRQALRCARVIGKAGLALGGRDIDRWIADLLHPGGASDSSLLAVAERLKCRLSEAEEALEIWCPPQAPPQPLRLSRQQLDQLLEERGLLLQLDDLLEQVLAAARREGGGGDSLQGGLGNGIAAVLPVGGSSRIPRIRRWLHEHCGAIPLRDERPVEAVVLGALALTPGVQIRDVLAQGVSLRCWDRRSNRHHWHPLFVPGQAWPTSEPLELVLACSRDGQSCLELVLGEPQPQQRSEVVFRDGLPVLRPRQAGAATVRPWPQQPSPLSLDPPGERGEDRLRLRLWIDAAGQLQLEGTDLRSQAPVEPRSLGIVR